MVGSALVDQVAAHLDSEGRAKASLPGALLGLVRELATSVRGARSIMNWLTNFVRPKLQALVRRADVPDNLWDKCGHAAR